MSVYNSSMFFTMDGSTVKWEINDPWLHLPFTKTERVWHTHNTKYEVPGFASSHNYRGSKKEKKWILLL